MATVSVIMPLHNAEAFLKDSVQSVIDQSFQDWELWIVEDHSTDNSYVLAAELAESDQRIHLIRTERNSGAAAARNLGISNASGKFVAFLDSDDLWSPEKLKKQIARLKESGAALCYTSYSIIDEYGGSTCRDYLVPEYTTFQSLLYENVIGCSTVLMDAALAKSHPFNRSFFHEDYALWLGLLRSGYRAVGCPEVLASWRYHANSRSFDKFSSVRNRWIVYRNAVGLPVGQSIDSLIRYGVAGLKKYSKLSKRKGWK